MTAQPPTTRYVTSVLFIGSDPQINDGSAYSAATGCAATTPAHLPESVLAAAVARTCASAPHHIPTTVGPEPDTIAISAPTSRTAASVPEIDGHSDTAAGSRSLIINSAGKRQPGF